VNTKELEKIEMKNDGKDSERFQKLLRKVVNTPKEDIQEPKKNVPKKGTRKRRS
jgi:hypothetical protein